MQVVGGFRDLVFVIQLMIIRCRGALGAAVSGPSDEEAVREDEEGDQADDAADDDEYEVLGEGGGGEVRGAGPGRHGWRGIVVAAGEGGEVERVVGVGSDCGEAGGCDVRTAGGGRGSFGGGAAGGRGGVDRGSG